MAGILGAVGRDVQGCPHGERARCTRPCRTRRTPPLLMVRQLHLSVMTTDATGDTTADTTTGSPDAPAAVGPRAAVDTGAAAYAELAAVGPYGVRPGHALITMVEPHPGHEYAYN